MHVENKESIKCTWEWNGVGRQKSLPQVPNFIIITLSNASLLFYILIINVSGLLHCTKKQKKRPTAHLTWEESNLDPWPSLLYFFSNTFVTVALHMFLSFLSLLSICHWTKIILHVNIFICRTSVKSSSDWHFIVQVLKNPWNNDIM